MRDGTVRRNVPTFGTPCWLVLMGAVDAFVVSGALRTDSEFRNVSGRTFRLGDASGTRFVPEYNNRVAIEPANIQQSGLAVSHTATMHLSRAASAND